MFSSEQMFTINGDNYENLAKVLKVAIDLCGWKGVKAFYEDKNGLVLCSYQCSGSTKYPFEATIPILVEQIKQYINNLSKEDLIRLAGEEPSNDGEVVLGWEVFHPLWYGENKIEKYESAGILAIRPCWIIYGK